MEYYTKRLEGKEVPSAYSLRIMDKEGNAKWTEANTVLLTWKGRPAILGLVTDVTERKRAEESLAESEKRYRFIAENVSDVIWAIDTNLRLTYFSPSITKMNGYSVEENMARGIEKSLSPASLEAVSGIVMRELAKKGKPNTATLLTPVTAEIEHKDGSKIWAESAGTLLRDSDGKPVEIVGVLRDITERKKAEEELQRKEQHFRALIENSSDGIAVVNRDGSSRYISPSLARMLGYDLGERIVMSMLNRVHPDDIKLVSDTFTRLAQNPGTTMRAEVRVQHKDGTWRTVEATGTALLHDPAVDGIVVNVRDITERKKVEEELQHQGTTLPGTHRELFRWYLSRRP